ncbi:MAG: hypothetical protein V1820_06535 [archaeon]
MVALDAIFDIIIACEFVFLAIYSGKLSNKVGVFRIANAWIMFSVSALIMAFHHLIDLIRIFGPIQDILFVQGSPLWTLSNTIYLVSAGTFLMATKFLLDSFLKPLEGR